MPYYLAKEVVMAAGIYKITNIVNGKKYIGSSIDLEVRKDLHFRQLKNSNHHNQPLQRAYLKYGKDNLIFEVLEVLESFTKEILLQLEQKYIDLENPEYNICKTAGSSLGRIVSEETRKKMRENHADVSGELNPMYGKKGLDSPNYGKQRSLDVRAKIGKNQPDHSGEKSCWYGKKHKPESIEKMRGKNAGEYSGNAKLTWEQIRKIREEHKQHGSLKRISKAYNISKKAVHNIVTNKTWKEKQEQ